MSKPLEELYNDMITGNNDPQILEEGIFDRGLARVQGAMGGVKGLGNTIKSGAKGALAGLRGDTEGVQAAKDERAQSGMKASYTAAKAKSIGTAFHNDMKALFGDEWQTQFPDLATGVQSIMSLSTAPTEPAGDATSEADPMLSIPHDWENPAPRSTTPVEVSEPKIAEPEPEPEESEPKPVMHPIGHKRAQKINSRIENEPRVRRRVASLLNKAEGQKLRPTQKVNWKQSQALNKLMGESFEDGQTLTETYNRMLEVPTL